MRCEEKLKQAKLRCMRKEKENNTWDSNVVPHRSTNQARTCLTSLSGREAVLSCWYGRSHYTRHINSTIQYKHCPPLQKNISPIADAGCRLPMSKINIDINQIMHSLICLPSAISHQPSARRHCLLYTRWRFRFVGTWSLTKPNRWTLQALLPGIPPLPSFRAEVYVAPVSCALTMSEEESKDTTRCRRTGRYLSGRSYPSNEKRNHFRSSPTDASTALLFFFPASSTASDVIEWTIE